MFEYSSIANCHVLGNFVATPEIVQQCVIAHEIAHFVQYTHCGSQENMQKPHGVGWRRLYSWLRRELINPHAFKIGIDTKCLFALGDAEIQDILRSK